MPLLITGSDSMRASRRQQRSRRLLSRLEGLKNSGKPDGLERKHQSGGRHCGMSVFVEFEAGHLEIGSLVNKSAILCAQSDMFGQRHIESTAIHKSTSGLLVV